MTDERRSKTAVAAIVAALALTLGALSGCSDEPTPGRNTAAPTAPANANAATPSPSLQADGTPKAPLGMEDTIEGRVIGLFCYKQNRNASPEQAKACAKEYADKGGALGVLGADGTVYVDKNPDARLTNGKLEPFIGEEVTIQGQMVGDAPELGWDDVKVKKFDMKLTRRKGSGPAGAARAPAKPPAKKT
jgi:hypothetical protein